MMKEKTLIELLIIVFNSIRTHTPKTISGFCPLTYSLYSSNKMTREEYILLKSFWGTQANITDFVSPIDIRMESEKTGSCYLPMPEAWLFTPNDWKSRRKWLKEYIKSHT